MPAIKNTSATVSLETIVEEESGITLGEWLQSELEVMLMRSGVLSGYSQKEAEDMLLHE